MKKQNILTTLLAITLTCPAYGVSFKSFKKNVKKFAKKAQKVAADNGSNVSNHSSDTSVKNTLPSASSIEKKLSDTKVHVNSDSPNSHSSVVTKSVSPKVSNKTKSVTISGHTRSLKSERTKKEINGPRRNHHERIPNAPIRKTDSNETLKNVAPKSKDALPTKQAIKKNTSLHEVKTGGMSKMHGTEKPASSLLPDQALQRIFIHATTLNKETGNKTHRALSCTSPKFNTLLQNIPRPHMGVHPNSGHLNVPSSNESCNTHKQKVRPKNNSKVEAKNTDNEHAKPGLWQRLKNKLSGNAPKGVSKIKKTKYKNTNNSGQGITTSKKSISDTKKKNIRVDGTPIVKKTTDVKTPEAGSTGFWNGLKRNLSSLFGTEISGKQIGSMLGVLGVGGLLMYLLRDQSALAKKPVEPEDLLECYPASSSKPSIKHNEKFYTLAYDAIHTIKQTTDKKFKTCVTSKNKKELLPLNIADMDMTALKLHPESSKAMSLFTKLAQQFDAACAMPGKAVKTKQHIVLAHTQLSKFLNRMLKDITVLLKQEHEKKSSKALNTSTKEHKEKDAHHTTNVKEK